MERLVELLRELWRLSRRPEQVPPDCGSWSDEQERERQRKMEFEIEMERARNFGKIL